MRGRRPLPGVLHGGYPNYRQVIPHLVPELVTIAGDRRPGVIAWLRALCPDTFVTWTVKDRLGQNRSLRNRMR
ncbi:MAG: hypothetical protein NTW21_07585 [Verrucomicrobia bacterium]|nr:hypothetical protein [Verrucomicrobiota bacterium]